VSCATSADAAPPHDEAIDARSRATCWQGLYRHRVPTPQPRTRNAEDAGPRVAGLSVVSHCACWPSPATCSADRLATAAVDRVAPVLAARAPPTVRVPAACATRASRWRASPARRRPRARLPAPRGPGAADGLTRSLGAGDQQERRLALSAARVSLGLGGPSAPAGCSLRCVTVPSSASTSRPPSPPASALPASPPTSPCRCPAGVRARRSRAARRGASNAGRGPHRAASSRSTPLPRCSSPAVRTSCGCAASPTPRAPASCSTATTWRRLGAATTRRSPRPRSRRGDQPGPRAAPAALAQTAELEAARLKARDPLFPDDAYRHVYWSWLLTREFGAAFAERVTDAHEEGTTYEYGEAARRMDLRNNALGASGPPAACRPRSSPSACAATRGWCVLRRSCCALGTVTAVQRMSYVCGSLERRQVRTDYCKFAGASLTSQRHTKIRCPTMSARLPNHAILRTGLLALVGGLWSVSAMAAIVCPDKPDSGIRMFRLEMAPGAQCWDYDLGNVRTRPAAGTRTSSSKGWRTAGSPSTACSTCRPASRCSTSPTRRATPSRPADRHHGLTRACRASSISRAIRAWQYLIIFKTGVARGDPDWAAFLLPRGVLSGSCPSTPAGAVARAGLGWR